MQNMDYNTDSNRKTLVGVFGPKLEADPNFKLTSAQTYRYNCIAYAMGMEDRWVDTLNVPWHWWPPVKKDMSLDCLITAFEYLGFEACGMDDSIENDYDKVVLYQKNNEWRHAARVLEANKYHSKFGESFDGTHSNGDVLEIKYGTPYQVMKRSREKAHLTDDLKGEFVGHTRSLISITTPEGRIDHVTTYKGKTYLEFSGEEVIVDIDNTRMLIILKETHSVIACSPF